ncbi:MAG TPA: hypothetical protein VHN37_08090, partial [Actinomycetota bacterium]|nr:hypothetical protein [Actinomycetota bacterium]
MSDLALFGVASDGSTDQWDGFKTVPGILLGWLQKAGVPFPPHGYDLWRARAVDPLRLVWDELRQSMDHRRKYDHLGHVVIESPDDFRIIGSALHVRPAKHVELTWPDPAWYLKVNPASQGAPSGPVRVEAFAGGKRRFVRTLSPGTNPLVLRTRGIERVRLSAPGAPGAVSSIGYGLLHDVRRR